MVSAGAIAREPSFTQTKTGLAASFTASRVVQHARSWLVEVGEPARTRLVRTLGTLKQPRVIGSLGRRPAFMLSPALLLAWARGTGGCS